MKDQDKIHPHTIDLMLSRQAMTIKKNINKEISSWSNT